jgi:hypothetical protein
MNRARQLALAAAALAVLALGLRWHLSRGAEALMVELARRAAPVGTLTWRDARGGFDGRIGASGLAFEAGGTRFTAEALSLDLGGLWPVLRRSLPGAPHDLPEALRLELTGIDLPTRAAAPADAAPALGLESLDVVPCGGLDGAAVLQAVHGPRLTGDLAIGYRFDLAERRLALDLELGARGLIAIDLELELEALEPVGRLEDLVRARPVARRGALTLTEQGWYAASAAHCAARSALAPDAWLEAHLAGALELLAASGLAPSADLVAGYRAFRRAPTTARISFDNPALHGAEALLARPPDEIAALVGLAVQFNGVPVVDARLGVADAQRMLAVPPLADAPLPGGAESLVEDAVRPLVSPVPADEPAAPAREPARGRGTAPAYAPPPGSTALTPSTRPPSGGVTLRWEALRAARGTPVAVVMKDGRTLRGVVRDATPWQLSLEQRLKGGSVVMPLDRDEVARVVDER